MRRWIVVLSCCVLFAKAVAGSDLDLEDFDDDLMDGMDDAYKSLEVVIPAHNAASAKIDAGTLRDGLAKTQQYFEKKSVKDAVGWARDAQASTQKILEALERSDFDSAMTAARETKETCRRCHDVYKHKERDKDK